MTAADDTLRLRHEMCMRVVDYQEALSELLTVVEDDDGRVHRYYTRDAGITLSIIAEDLRRLAAALGDDGMDAWLESEKRKMLGEAPMPVAAASAPESTGVSRHQLARKALIGAGAAGALLVGWQGVCYLASGNDRGRFSRAIATAEAAMDAGDYREALDRADSASQNYTAAFMPGMYEDKARTVARTASEKLFEEWRADVRRYLNAGRPELAKARTLELPANLELASDAAKIYAETCGEIDRLLVERCDAFVDEMICGIHKNGGRFPAQARPELESILKVAPHHYWLNYLKKMADEE